MKWQSVDEILPEPERTVFVLSGLYGYQVDMIQRIAPNMPYRFNVPDVKYWVYPENPEDADKEGKQHLEDGFKDD